MSEKTETTFYVTKEDGKVILKKICSVDIFMRDLMNEENEFKYALRTNYPSLEGDEMFKDFDEMMIVLKENIGFFSSMENKKNAIEFLNTNNNIPNDYKDKENVGEEIKKWQKWLINKLY